MAFSTLLIRVSYFVFLLLFPTIISSNAAIGFQSSSDITSPTAAMKESSSEIEKQNKYENMDCTTEMRRMSARLDLLEQQISLLNSKNEQQEKYIRLMNEKINQMNTLVDLKHSVLETKIMERVSQILLPINSKIEEQTKQIKGIFEMKEAKTPLETTPSSDFGNCSLENNTVTCVKVSILDIKAFFQRSDLIDNNPLRSINVTLLRGDELIPADIFGNKKTEKIVIRCDDDDQHLVASLKVDANAFQSTKNYTNTLALVNFDISQLDLGFLSGFNQLTELIFFKVRRIEKSLPTLPPLPQLALLEMNNVTGLNDPKISFPNLSTGGLKKFALLYSGENISDASVGRILDWILLSSAKTLEKVLIVNIGITEIPPQIPSFAALEYLVLDQNSITTIKNGALSFSVPVKLLRLWENKVNSIEPGAFQGDFSNTEISVQGNSLTRLDESMFRPMLEQMLSGRGELYCFDNKIDCSAENVCHLAWIIRNSELRRLVWGECSNGTYFGSLKENDFNHCPVNITKKPY